MQGSRGFSLVELLIVVAIVGVLAAMAVPKYQDYLNRTRVAEGLHLVNGAKLAVAEYQTTQGHYPRSNEEAGIASDIQGNSVHAVTVSTQGQITLAFNDRFPNLANKTIVFAPKSGRGSLKWDCSGGNMDSRYRPASCRSQTA